ncbi:MAG TPA: helix-turn-helix domain-containing protein [Rhodothermales bacterium]|nr:helix-turn-helix domain-containing protein [Rhodothermales bacterium]
MSGEDWLTTDDVAARLRVNEETVRRWLREKKLRGVRIGFRGGYRIAAADLDAFLQKEYGYSAAQLPAAPPPALTRRPWWRKLGADLQASIVELHRRASASFGEAAANRIVSAAAEQALTEKPKKEGK